MADSNGVVKGDAIGNLDPTKRGRGGDEVIGQKIPDKVKEKITGEDKPK